MEEFLAMTFVHGPEQASFVEGKPAKLRFFLGYVDEFASGDGADEVSGWVRHEPRPGAGLCRHCLYLKSLSSRCQQPSCGVYISTAGFWSSPCRYFQRDHPSFIHPPSPATISLIWLKFEPPSQEMGFISQWCTMSADLSLGKRRLHRHSPNGFLVREQTWPGG